MNIDDAHKAVDFIRDNASVFANAKADRIGLEEWRKSKKALLMNECPAGTPVNAREQFAYSHPEYIQIIDGLKEAVKVEETIKWQMVAAEMRCEVLRSAEASARAEGRATQ
jgi:hypothetical protein